MTAGAGISIALAAVEIIILCRDRKMGRFVKFILIGLALAATICLSISFFTFLGISNAFK
jgi:hypothetical protein